MRPMAGDSAFGRPRITTREDDVHHPPASSASSSHMSFVFADEASVDSYIDQSQSAARSFFRDPRKHRDPTTSQAVRGDDKNHDSRSRPTSQHQRPPSRDAAGPAHSPVSRHSAFTCSPASFGTFNQTELSRPITPIMLGPSISGSSIISSPSSRRNSLGGSISEHALSEDGEQETPGEHNSSKLAGGAGAPQLVMPSIEMPARRRFTETGKNLGRLKILLAGDSGIGKTSLIKSIAQACQHIVHVDPIIAHPQLLRRHSGATESDHLRPTTGIVEILASTKPYPEWWAEVNVSSSGRRKSLGDGVLDRNICFVDTPGYGRGSSSMEMIVSCVDYVEAHLNKMASESMSESELLNMLGGAGGCQTDVVLYMIAQKLKPADLEYMRRLSRLTNVIPILSRVDTMSSQQIKSCKEQISCQLQDAGIQTFSFDRFPTSPNAPTSPYAVSSAKGSDHDIMDASVLMSSNYAQPLIGTDLLYVVDKLFSLEGVSWLRHAAGRKYLDWISTDSPRPRHLYKPLETPGPSVSNALVRYTTQLGGLRRASRPEADSSGFRFDGGTRLYVADWAADLQRSLAAEREQDSAMRQFYDELDGKADRAMVATHGDRSRSCVQRRRQYGSVRQKPAKRTRIQQDPLGLLQVSADLKATSWVALEVLGSLGILGGLAFWLSRQHWHSEPVLLVDDWARFWGMEF
ncbi:Septin-domain-containing protein [Microdochium trichocladiopsis]|uniref:Septin-domain-containing protein n=1 Tax=Microdochium trichocladiopsis TaxID=1682393 RepID=A0A9P9BUT2_9PEZI|nr:Septin-domain-containing protein [Microdochium trichocladiopsis]KAH7041306.1 Septin-domain-containing protein [Microdochium trichocladiopsis]